MSISFVKVFKAVGSQKYRKENILYYFLFMLLISTVSYLPIYKFLNNVKVSLWIIALSAIIAIILLDFVNDGFLAITSNNEINKKQDVFPSFKEIATIFTTGFKFTCGYFILAVMVYFIPFLLGCFSFLYLLAASYKLIGGHLSYLPLPPVTTGYMITAALGIVVSVILTILLSYYITVPLRLAFYRTLNLKDLFNYKNASVIRKEKGKLYSEYFLNLILVGIIAGVFSNIATNFFPKQLLMTNFGTFYTIIIADISIAIQTLLQPNLNGQIVNTNLDDVDEEEQESYEDDEYYEDEEYYDDTNG